MHRFVRLYISRCSSCSKTFLYKAVTLVKNSTIRTSLLSDSANCPQKILLNVTLGANGILVDLVLRSEAFYVGAPSNFSIKTF